MLMNGINMGETPKEIYIIVGPDAGSIYRVTGESETHYYLEDGECTITEEKWKCIPLTHELAMEIAIKDSDYKGVF